MIFGNPRRLLLALSLVALARSQPDGPLDLGDDAGKDEVAASTRVNALHLNAHTFNGNVLKKSADLHVEHWLVSFCPNWWEPCQNLAMPFDQFGLQWERKLNTELLTKKVRFATVDCATDKVLCNEQHVEQYPTVHHYHNGKRVATWIGGRKSDAEKLAKFLDKRLGSAVKAAPSTEDRTLEATRTSIMERLKPGDRAIDFALVVTVLSLNAWAVFTNPRLWQQSAPGMAKESCCGAAPAAPPATAVPLASAAQPRSVARFLPEDWSGPSGSIEL